MAKTKTTQKEKPKRKLTAVKAKHRVVLKNLSENGGNMAQAIRDSGLYSPTIIDNPQRITNTKSWQELVEEEMPDSMLSGVHTNLLKSTRLDHMVFPLGPEGEDDPILSGAQPNKKGNQPEEIKERTTLTDAEIIAMLAEVNCTVRRIVHGETARHVYFWASDNKSRKEALDMAYKLKGRYSPEGVPPVRGNVYNFIFAPEMRQKIRGMEDLMECVGSSY